MPVLTFYAYLGAHHNRVPVTTISEWPTCWLDLKDKIQEAAMTLWQERNVGNAILTLEVHLPGKFAWKTLPGHYGQSRLRFKRGIEFSGKMSFNPMTNEVTLEQCGFGLNLWRFTEEYRVIERQDLYHVPQLIPKALESLEGNLESLMMDPSGLRYVDYTSKPRVLYAPQDEQRKRRPLYESSCVGKFLPPGQRTREEVLADQ